MNKLARTRSEAEVIHSQIAVLGDLINVFRKWDMRFEVERDAWDDYCLNISYSTSEPGIHRMGIFIDLGYDGELMEMKLLEVQEKLLDKALGKGKLK